ncbi:MAG: hypothetical protein RIT14_1245, partial [Pseudomonadota bacterium]
AMTQLTNTVSFLGVGDRSTISLTYAETSDNPFNVIFLRDIPDSDDAPIDQDFVDDNATLTGAEARYVYVFSQSDDMRSFFFNPVSQGNEIVPIGADAVATLRRATCDLTPMFMCNPFTGSGSETNFINAFNAGTYHGRMVKLDISPSTAAPGPGNIGFLDFGSGTPDLAKALAGDPFPQCLELETEVTTQPGGAKSAFDGYNTRFDMFSNNFGGIFGEDGDYPPALNVRKAFIRKGANSTTTPACVTNPEGTLNLANAPIFSDNPTPTADFGGRMNSGNWNLTAPVTGPDGTVFPAYWTSLYGASGAPALPTSSVAGQQPSRYDVYTYEIATTFASNGKALTTQRSNFGETANPQCYDDASKIGQGTDRRTMFVAVVDCAGFPTNGKKTVPVQVYAKVFLVHPVRPVAGAKMPELTLFDTINIEIVGLSEGSRGGADEFLRDEAVLVR